MKKRIALLICLGLLGCEEGARYFITNAVPEETKKDICKEVPGNGFGLCKDEPVDSVDTDSL